MFTVIVTVVNPKNRELSEVYIFNQRLTWSAQEALEWVEERWYPNKFVSVRSV